MNKEECCRVPRWLDEDVTAFILNLELLHDDSIFGKQMREVKKLSCMMNKYIPYRP